MYDLNIIKKYYGENMSHLCRKLFPTLLEHDGLLSKIMISKFAPNKTLYVDIIDSNNVINFKNLIYSLIDKIEFTVTNNTVKGLLNSVGYDLYECKTEKDIQGFRKYYKKTEELCTFTNGDRLNTCYVFFAVKKNVDEIKRDDYKNPKRQDEYGTSVLSIQFTKGTINTLSIKNRYNHTVDNPDATYSNNLDNIISGLTYAFNKDYNLNINSNIEEFELVDYVLANDGKLYKYNYERN